MALAECLDVDAVGLKVIDSSINSWPVLSSTFLISTLWPFDHTANVSNDVVGKANNFV